MSKSFDKTEGIGTAVMPLKGRQLPVPASKPLSNPRHEKYCRLRAQLLPKLDAFRNAGFTAETNHTAYSNLYRLEKRKNVQDRIAYFCRQDEKVLQEKRKRIEEVLWLVHEANVADLWETVEVPRLDKDGNPVLDKDGNAVMEKIQRPRLLSELPEDLQRVVESVSIDGHGRMVPKIYSKLQANAELRKLLKIDGVTRDDRESTRLTTAELVAQLEQQSKALGIQLDLSYQFSTSR
jgi:hypothetical protein